LSKNSSRLFNFLQNNPEIKTSFYNDLSTLLSSVNFHIIGIVVDKVFLKQKYGTFANEPYHYAIKMLVEKFYNYLRKYNGVGRVCVEARNNGALDTPLDDYFKFIYHNGTRYGGTHGSGQYILTPDMIASKIVSSNIKFFNKKKILEDKINGLEICDLLCNPVMQIIKEDIEKYSKNTTRPAFDIRQCPVYEKEQIRERIIQPRKYMFEWQP